MSREITLHEAAERDLAAHVRHIAENNPRAARRFAASTEATFRSLLRMPHLGSPCEFTHPSLANLRYRLVKGFKNYVIIYQPIPTGIEIVRIFHAAQDWQAAFEE